MRLIQSTLAVVALISSTAFAGPAGFKRLPDNPIITPGSSATLGNNINGPSLIKVPDWMDEPLGKYYLYFAHHAGKYIRLAYADSLEGPWSIYEPGTLPLSEVDDLAVYHIASPDVLVDGDNKRIVMYYHFPVQKDSKGAETAIAFARPYNEKVIRANGIVAGQFSGVAVSTDGIDFEPASGVIAPFYLRVFEHEGCTYGIAKDGGRGGFLMQRTDNVLDQPFKIVKQILPRMRHAAVWVDEEKDRLYVAYSRVGDAPEHILLSWADLNDDPTSWEFSEPVSLLQPEHEWEGANFRIKPSRPGLSKDGMRQLRDPALYQEGETLYLVYSIAGESGLAIARASIAEVRAMSESSAE